MSTTPEDAPQDAVQQPPYLPDGSYNPWQDPGATQAFPPAPPGPHPYYGYVQQPRPGRGMAIASLVLGIVGTLMALPFFFPLSVPCGVLATIFGALGRRSGIGRAGLVLGITALGVTLVWIIWFASLAGS